MRVVRVYHSAVVREWRSRDRRLRDGSVALTLCAPRSWNEGGSVVRLEVGTDDFVRPVRTIGTHPYGFLYDPIALARVIRSGRPELLDCHEEPASLAALEILVLRLLTARRAPLLFYGAQNIEKRYPPPFRWIERWALRAAAGVYVCNAEAGEIFRRKGFRGEVAVIGLGVDLARFSPAAEPACPPFRIGYVGRLEWRKGIQVAIEAVAGLGPEVQLHVYGSGPDEARLRSFAESCGAVNRVDFHGYTAHDDLPAVYRGLHALVVPSQTTPGWVEQFGRVVVEGMASGVPVLGSDSGSIPEVIGDAGVVVPEADVEAWRAAIERIVTDPAERDRLRTAGPEHARRYGWAAVAAQHLELYRKVRS